MKKTITSLFLLMGMGATAQNGGQLNENNSLKIEYIGITSSGNPIIKATNKQDCTSEIRVLHGQNVRFKMIEAHTSDTFVLPINVCNVTAKATTNYGFVDYGQVETNVCNVLPLRFEQLRVQKTGVNTAQISFKIVELSDHKLYIQLSKDGMNYKRIGIEVPSSAKVGDTYIVNIKF
jgi:hypothetical protein